MPDIAQILRQQLKSTLQLASLLEEQPGAGTQRRSALKCHALLRQAVETGCSRANKSTTDNTGQQLDEVNLKIKELEGKAQTATKIETDCSSTKGCTIDPEVLFAMMGSKSEEPFGRRAFSTPSSFNFAGRRATVKDDEDEEMTGT